MKLFRKLSSTPASFNGASNILGATGLSRASLRQLFAQSGLFGPRSALTTLEQAGIHAELALPAGAVPALPRTDEIANHRRIAAIRSLARVILSQDADGYDRQVKFARSLGVEARAISEAARTVRTAMFLYSAGVPLRQDVSVCNVAPIDEADFMSPALASA